MSTVTSKDGTEIAYETLGSGPAVVLVDGALCYRDNGPARPLAKQLASQFTVYIYDRRGRGASGHGESPWDVQREVEDLDAVLAAAGGAQACLYGISSGAVLALEAVHRGVKVKRLAVYEAPIVTDAASRPALPAGYEENLRTLIAEGKRGPAVKYFMRRGIGLPGLVVALFPVFPAWSKLKGVAHTLADDASIMMDPNNAHVPADRYSGVDAPTVVMFGGKSPEWIKSAASQVAAAVPGAEIRELPGQTHMVKPAAIGPVLAEYFAG